MEKLTALYKSGYFDSDTLLLQAFQTVIHFVGSDIVITAELVQVIQQIADTPIEQMSANALRQAEMLNQKLHQVSLVPVRPERREALVRISEVTSRILSIRQSEAIVPFRVMAAFDDSFFLIEASSTLRAPLLATNPPCAPSLLPSSRELKDTKLKSIKNLSKKRETTLK